MTSLLRPAAPATAQDGPAYVPPVDAPVADGFRPPPTPFGPGNRGLEYRTEPGSDVWASGDGAVVFAGQVGGTLHVTIEHADGLRTSYSFLTEVHVVLGQRVRQGDRLGTVGARFHFGARLGDEYFDPATLFDGSHVEVELVPFEVPPGSTPEEERTALAQLSMTSGGGLGLPLPDLGAAAGWLAERAGMLGHYVNALDPWQQGLDLSRTLTQRVLFPPPCTGEGTAAAPSSPDRVAVTVGGLGSTSESSSIDRLDVDDLGYRPDDVVRYSYAGGQARYTSEDSQGDLRVAAERLADLVERVAAERSGIVDIYGHSMGGVVTRLALLELERRGFPTARLGVVATLAAPHRGAQLAGWARAARSSVLGDAALGATEQVMGTGLDPESPAVAQLAPTSDVVAELADAGVPEDVELVSVAARGDVVVPSPRSRVDGARNVTVPETGWHAHGDMVAAEETTRELSLALADMPARCVGLWDVVSDTVTGHSISVAEDLGGAALLGVP